jgi:hypothetical protein
VKPLALVIVVGCAGTAPPPVEPAGAIVHEEATPVACIAAGFYNVTVDLTHAQITQVSTRMAEWCKSMLMAVPAAQMNTMRIAYEDSALTVRWPPSRTVHATATSACAFAIADQPIPVTFTFAGSAAEGIATYSLGTANHPDENCTATNAKLVLERAGD